jgi:hypothetical protein
LTELIFKPVSVLLIVIAGLAILLLILFLIFYLRHLIPLRKKEDGFKYVFIEADGTVRELNNEEEKYLTEVFWPNDGDRPYIKTRYWDRTADGKLSGFILRKRVPGGMRITKNH